MPGKRYSLPNLPYKYNALEPTVSEKIMTLHHDKHHLAYVNGANAALDKLEKARQTGFAGIDVRGISRDLAFNASGHRSEEHTSELQSQSNLVCRLLLEKKKHQA